MFLSKGRVYQAEETVKPMRESTYSDWGPESDRTSGSVRNMVNQEQNPTKMRSVRWVRF